MALNRSGLRNTRFYDAANPEVVLAGFRQNGSISAASLLSILEILLVTDGKPVCVRARASGDIVTRNDISLEVGDYDIYCDNPIQLTNETWVQRLISDNTVDIETRFRNEIRARDRKCVISGIANPDIHIQLDMWTPFVATYIFPLEHEDVWIKSEYRRWITDMDDVAGSSNIHSAQNRFLLSATVQQLFDQYLISVNPDDGYKVVVFDIDAWGYDGRILDPVCRNPADPHHVSDDILRWHFRQSVLANMRGLGEPIFEHDFPPGTDMVVDRILRDANIKKSLAKSRLKLNPVHITKRLDWTNTHKDWTAEDFERLL
ncbi:hypothetical protein HOY82DRAFT_619227 [Tuber indicum]|nr:hypothetical protein HOY82DRAFT_619227 [Tuber indicum]